LLYSKMLM